jgi:hypothetical protein
VAAGPALAGGLDSDLAVIITAVLDRLDAPRGPDPSDATREDS